jgi:hypothetical protein
MERFAWNSKRKNVAGSPPRRKLDRTMMAMGVKSRFAGNLYLPHNEGNDRKAPRDRRSYYPEAGIGAHHSSEGLAT